MCLVKETKTKKFYNRKSCYTDWTLNVYLHKWHNNEYHRYACTTPIVLSSAHWEHWKMSNKNNKSFYNQADTIASSLS